MTPARRSITAGRPLRIVLVDDHQMVVLGLRALFSSRPELKVVAWAHDAEAGAIACRDHAPDVAVLDIGLEGSTIDGLELCRRLHDEQPELAVVLYTGREELGLAERTVRAGALGVVPKTDRTGDIMRAVLLAGHGRSFVSPSFAARAAASELPDLPPQQLAVLRLLAQGLERREIAERMGLGEETVKTHLAGLRRRLGARTSAHAVALGLRNALFEPLPDPDPDPD